MAPDPPDAVTSYAPASSSGRGKQTANIFYTIARRTQKSILKASFRPSKKAADQRSANSAALLEAAQRGDFASVRKLIESRKAHASDRDSDKVTPLHWAAFNGHFDVCQYLIFKGAEVDARGGELRATPLHWAIRHNAIDIVQLLVYHRADPNVQDAQGFSAIHVAVHASTSNILSFLLQEPVDVDTRDLFGHTTLMWAAYQGDHQSVGLLLKHGAKVNAEDDLGRTPLHWAIANGNRLCICFLMSYGADVHTRDREGRTPQDMAEELVSLLTMKTIGGWKVTDADDSQGDGGIGSPTSSREPRRSQPRPMFRGMSTGTLEVEEAPPSYEDYNATNVPAYHLRGLGSPPPTHAPACTEAIDGLTAPSGLCLPGGDGTDESTGAGLPSLEKVDILDLVLGAVRSTAAKERLFSLVGHFAGEALCVIQQILDDPTAFGLSQDWEDRFVLRRLLTSYSQRADIIPPTLFLDGVRCEDKETLEIGGYADIFQAKHEGELVALKRLRISMVSKENQSYRKAFIREALTWRQLRHPHILQFSGVDSTTFNGYFCMVSPWMDFGSLCSCMHKLDASGVEIPYRRWILEIARGLKYLHRELVVHGDLRGANILIDYNLCVRLADFGLALFADASTASLGSHIGGSARWMCPGLLSGDLPRPNYSCDVYAFGCVCVEVYSRRSPYHNFNDVQVITKVLHHGARPARPSGIPGEAMCDDLWALVQRCWDKDATCRPSTGELVSEIERLTNATDAV